MTKELDELAGAGFGDFIESNASPGELLAYYTALVCWEEFLGARYKLAMDGVQVDLEKSKGHLIKAAEGMAYLSNMYREGKIFLKDDKEAIIWMDKSKEVLKRIQC